MSDPSWKNPAKWADFTQALAPVLDRGIPPGVAVAALQANPWFTAYYLETAVKNISGWFNGEAVVHFLEKYPKVTGQEKRVAIVAAGNVPLVGLHDVLMVLFSGNIALIKASHQDEIMLRWLLEAWTAVVPALASRYFFVKEVKEADAVIATGSNNTARYFREAFVHIPALIRNNRYSVAVLDHSWTEEMLHLLAEDLLLFNGLGCRNVSNLLAVEGFEQERLTDVLRSYPQELLNPHYVRKIAVEKGKARVMTHSFTETPALLLASSHQLGYAQMGWGWWITVENHAAANQLIALSRDQIQCVVPNDTFPGNTQHPELNEFADDTDTLKWLHTAI